MAPRSKTHKMMEATDSFAYGEPAEIVHRGQLLAEDHPAVKARPESFKETEYLRGEVEQATAAPGEQRA